MKTFCSQDIKGGRSMTSTKRKESVGCGGSGRWAERVCRWSASLPRCLFAIFVLFMSFGIYNPGWRCLDSNNDNNNNVTDEDAFNTQPSSSIRTPRSNATFPPYKTDGCQLHSSCDWVEYNPTASTVVTEWDLACGRSWIASTMTSSQMVGVLVGAYLTGYVGDRLGQRFTLLGAMLINAVLHVLIIFSTSWPVFAVIMVFIGICSSAYKFLPLSDSKETISSTCDGAAASFPFHSLGAMLFAICAWITKDWRIIHLITAALSAMCFITLLLLTITNKNTKALNGENIIDTHDKVRLTSRGGTKTRQNISSNSGESPRRKQDSTKDLFRKGFRFYTFIITSVCFTEGLTVYLISFGVKLLPGNLYINFLTLSAVQICSNAGTILLDSKLGRRTAAIVLLVLTTASLLAVALLSFVSPNKTDNHGITVLALLSRAFAGGAWYLSTTLIINELIPLVLRDTIQGWASFCGHTGASIAPFLVPMDANLLYVSYLVMGILNLLCSFFYFLISSDTSSRVDPNDTDLYREENKSKDKERSPGELYDSGVKSDMTSKVELIDCHQCSLIISM